MKHLLMSATLILASGSAFAMPMHEDFAGPARMEAERLVPGGNFDQLTTAQVNAIEAILSSDNENRGGQIRAILN